MNLDKGVVLLLGVVVLLLLLSIAYDVFAREDARQMSLENRRLNEEMLDEIRKDR